MKLTDNEIINCLNDTIGKEHIGIYCSDKNGNYTTTIRLVDIIDLIIRLKAENEMLKNISNNKTKALLRHDTFINELHEKLKTIKSEAIKEFAERLKEKFKKDFNSSWFSVYKPIDNLVKELTEDFKE